MVGGPGAVVVKRGHDPVEVVVDGRRTTVPVPAIAAGTDTTGAGDASPGASSSHGWRDRFKRRPPPAWQCEQAVALACAVHRAP